ncbi:MAG: hypothetical protein QOF76_1149 [Solirubrobacteraceae bacterium]|nr:hypothetical protein [Solirubrobacteraceae bacterium]
MSDDFSWAPFGTPDDHEAPPPLAPLPPHPDDEEKAVPPAASVPPPEAVVQSEPDPLPFEASEPPPLQDAPATDLGWSAPQPSTPPPTRVTPPTSTGAVPNLGSLDVSDFGALAQNASTAVSREIREQLEAPGSKEAGQAFLWGILGVTVCPFLVPSIMAVVYGNRAKMASRGLGGQHHPRGTWGLVLGWIGIGFWMLVAVLAVVGAFSST